MKTSLYISSIFICVLSTAFLQKKLPVEVLYLYITMSFITFFLYAIDKSKAKRNVWRIKENTLHLCALCGGWPGAAYAQILLRHKSSKRAFKVIYWCSVLLNLSLLIWCLLADDPELFSFIQEFNFI